MDSYRELISNAIASDPIENKIIQELFKLKHQNERLQKHISQTGSWATIRKVDVWKPFDFYHYFCNKFQEAYRKEYRMQGSLIRVYQRIEAFIADNKISNGDYKEFIDTAFERYFNSINPPHIAYVCSPKLFLHLMKKGPKKATAKDFYVLDEQLEHENDQFERYVKYQGLYEYSHV